MAAYMVGKVLAVVYTWNDVIASTMYDLHVYSVITSTVHVGLY